MYLSEDCKRLYIDCRSRVGISKIVLEDEDGELCSKDFTEPTPYTVILELDKVLKRNHYYHICIVTYADDTWFESINSTEEFIKGVFIYEFVEEDVSGVD